jgi:soluble lytic murein transglycosylase-like protein
MKPRAFPKIMYTTIAAPVALLLALAGVATLRQDATPSVLRASTFLPACGPSRLLGVGGGGGYDAVIIRHSRKHGLNPRLVKAIIATESSFEPKAVSYCGARGLMQVMPATAADLGVKRCDLSDPETNISVGTKYLAVLFKTARRRTSGKAATQSQVVRRVIAAYHSGPRVMNAPVWTATTRSYVRSVLSCYGSAESEVRPPKKAAATVAAQPKKRRRRIS